MLQYNFPLFDDIEKERQMLNEEEWKKSSTISNCFSIILNVRVIPNGIQNESYRMFQECGFIIQSSAWFSI